MSLRRTHVPVVLLFAGLVAGLAASSQGQTAYSSVGSASTITGVVDAYRVALGSLFPTGDRREINWDGVPDSAAAPNNLPADFFNVTSPRGVVFATPGTGFQVSANAANPTGTPILFGNIHPTYPNSFLTFSPQRIFSPLGSNVMDVLFYLPGTSTPGLVKGFGAIFSSVNLANTTSIEYFGSGNNPLLKLYLPPVGTASDFSFLGVLFNAPQVARVRITTGTAALGVADNPGFGTDVVAMDDFIYSNPVPEPATLGLLAMGMIFWVRRRSH